MGNNEGLKKGCTGRFYDAENCWKRSNHPDIPQKSRMVVVGVNPETPDIRVSFLQKSGAYQKGEEIDIHPDFFVPDYAL